MVVMHWWWSAKWQVEWQSIHQQNQDHRTGTSERSMYWEQRVVAVIVAAVVVVVIVKAL